MPVWLLYSHWSNQLVFTKSWYIWYNHLRPQMERLDTKSSMHTKQPFLAMLQKMESGHKGNYDFIHFSRTLKKDTIRTVLERGFDFFIHIGQISSRSQNLDTFGTIICNLEWKGWTPRVQCTLSNLSFRQFYPNSRSRSIKSIDFKSWFVS